MKSTMKRFIEDDIRFLQKRLFEDAMEFVYQKKHDCDDLRAVIMSKEKPPMMKLDQAPSFYEKKLKSLTILLLLMALFMILIIRK
jgi:hypothetical protein